MAKQLRAAGRIHKPINIQNFIYLPGEDVVDSTKDLIEHIAELYARPDRDTETDKEDSQQPRIKLNKAIEALQKLRLYKEQQEDGKREVITTLLRHERRIQGRRLQNTKQTTIKSFFGGADRSILTSGS